MRTRISRAMGMTIVKGTSCPHLLLGKETYLRALQEAGPGQTEIPDAPQPPRYNLYPHGCRETKPVFLLQTSLWIVRSEAHCGIICNVSTNAPFVESPLFLMLQLKTKLRNSSSPRLDTVCKPNSVSLTKLTFNMTPPCPWTSHHMSISSRGSP